MRIIPLSLALGRLLAACMEPRPRATLTVEVVGPANPRPRCVSGDSSLGQLYPAGDPIKGARVRLTPGGLGGTTGADGKLVLKDLPGETYKLLASAPGFAEAAERTVTPGQGAALTHRIMLTPCVSTGPHRHRVGFGTSVTLTATTRCGDAWKGATFTWSQVEGPDARATVKTWVAPSLDFTTLALEKVKRLPATPRLLSFSPDEAGQYVFRVTARRADGVSASAYALVTSTDVTGPVTSVPPGLRYYLMGPKQGPWKWIVDRWPAGWIRTLEGATTRTPSVTPLPPSSMTVQADLIIREVNSNTSFTLVVGPWNLVNRDCGRSDCHPGLQKSWERTRHATTWRRLVEGELSASRGGGAASCAACHALGYNPSADNGGYDDVARQLGVTFPSPPTRGVYRGLPAALREVSSVYCLACHGPARVDPPVAEQPGRFAVGVCARCHDRKPEQDLVDQWRRNRMARTVTGDLNGPEAREECARCHTAQGFYYEHFALARPPSKKVAILSCCENLEPITCQACHSPMYAHDEAQVFRSGAVTLRDGLTLTGQGSGALCVTCHNDEHAPGAKQTLAMRLGPHAPQAELLHGKAGHALDATGHPSLEGVACASRVGEGCVTCHMDSGPAAGDPDHRQVGGHTFRMISAGGRPNVRPCQACHAGMTSFDPLARGDRDGDGRVESVRAEVDGLLALLKGRIDATIKAGAVQGCAASKPAGVSFKIGFQLRVVITDAGGHDLGDCDRSGGIERDEQPYTFPSSPQGALLHKAAYNYLVVVRDGSRGLHNVPYTVRLLQRTIAAVSGGKNLPGWELYR